MRIGIIDINIIKVYNFIMIYMICTSILDYLFVQ
jgi:hypothetical protein